MRALLALAAAVLLLRRRYAVVTVQGLSMLPTYAAGDRLLVRRGRGPATGDVVVFAPPAGWPAGPDWLVKRVAAVPGEPVPASCAAVAGAGPVPLGRLAVLGDNAARSGDSRRYGLVPLDLVYGYRRAGGPARRALRSVSS